MKKRLSLLLSGGIALALGALWAYSFSTRIGLLFVIPLWLKIIVMLMLGVNFALLAHFLKSQLLFRYGGGPAWVWLLVGSLILATLLIILLPYRLVPFRTTHALTIKARGGPITLLEALSPDDNPIPVESFTTEADVTFDAKGDFNLPETGALQYRRNQTGGLTLIFNASNSEAIITWDGTQKTIDLGALSQNKSFRLQDWKITFNASDETYTVTLPGHTWGDPDLFWAALAVLMPIADTITIASLIAGAVWLGLKLRREKRGFKLNWALLEAWLTGVAICILTVLLFRSGIPDFFPIWFLIIFLPTMLLLGYYQWQQLTQHHQRTQFTRIKKQLDRLTRWIKKANSHIWVLIVTLLIVIVISSVAQLNFTQPGIGVSGDSVHYLEGARHIAAGEGYVREIKIGDPVPITGWPPTYAAMLAIGPWLNIPLLQFVRFSNMILLALFLGLAAWITYTETHQVLSSLLVSLFCLLSVPIFEIYTWAMSETLFLVVSFLMILLWRDYQRKPGKWRAALLGIAAAVLVTTRLAGLALTATLAIMILSRRSRAWGQRLLEAGLTGGIALLPLVIYFYRNSQIGESVSEFRGLNLAPFKASYWATIFDQVASWFKLQFFFEKSWAATVMFFLIFGLTILVYVFQVQQRKKQNGSHVQRDKTLQSTFFLYILIYMVMIVLNIVILTPEQSLQDIRRFMLPLFPVYAILAASLIRHASWKKHRPANMAAIKAVIFVCLVVLLRLYLFDFTHYLQSPPTNARGYTDINTACQNELDVFENIPTDANIYTNNCEFLFFTSGYRCIHLPQEPEAFQAGGDVFEAVREGDIIAYMISYGFEPPGIDPFLERLEMYQYGCMLKFYRWPQTN